MTDVFDIAVVGAGIAGLSAASALAEGAKVIVLERQNAPATQATGRSAAILSMFQGTAPVRALTRASLPFFNDLHDEIEGRRLLIPRGLIHIARSDQLPMLEARAARLGDEGWLSRIGAEELQLRMPLLRPGYAVAGLMEPAARDLNMPALLDLLRKRLAKLQVPLATGAGVSGLQRCRGAWRIETAAGAFRARILVNAAGAWADSLAGLAGARPKGLMHLRRTALRLGTTTAQDLRSLPMVVDVDGRFYLKPEVDRLLASPADEVPMAPGDPRPDPLDVTLCLDRLAAAFAPVQLQVADSWAGLRSYAPDRLPLCGFDPDVDSFFWLAGLGGFGIQASPALAGLTSALVMGAAPDPILAELGLDPAQFAPGRFAA